MDNIIEPDATFDFSKISLVNPISVQGGAYFTKILFNDAPLYIQTPKTLTRQGFIKNGKKYSCDLMLDNENDSEQLISWIENLENRCQQLIYEKSDSWFETTLDKNDIETAFNSSLKIYKSGKYYLLRTHIKTNSLTQQPILKIFNENETVQTIDDVKPDTRIVSIIEIQGIRFTTRNFQIEYELKQVMIIKTDLFFENCLIKKKGSGSGSGSGSGQGPGTEKLNFELQLEAPPSDEPDESFSLDEDEFINQAIDASQKDLEKHEVEEAVVEEPVVEEPEEFKEVNFSLEKINHLETISLKKPNEVYYEIYKQARKKAKEAKKAAILAYLEARNIKKTYMLDDIENSDSDNNSDNSDFE